MSRYVLLIIINLPLLLAGIISAISSYKTGRISKKRSITEVLFWVTVSVGIIFIEPVYNTLLRHGLTNSTPMSLFDIVLLTLLLFCLLFIKQANEKSDLLNKKITRLQESWAISQAHHPKDKARTRST